MAAALFPPTLLWVARRSVRLMATLALAAMLLTVGGAGARPAAPAGAADHRLAAATVTITPVTGTVPATVDGSGRLSAAVEDGPGTTVAVWAPDPVDGQDGQPPLIVDAVPVAGSSADMSVTAATSVAPPAAGRSVRAIGPRAPPLR